MTEETASVTARRVAAYRLGFERATAPYGDPAADDALARHVAGNTVVATGEPMARYLRARTAFFDRMVVDAVERGVQQIVILGAGYDGRALRYARPGIRWWEVDRPATIADKQRRLSELGVDTGHVTCVPLDLDDGAISDALVDAGYQSRVTGLFLCEGVAVYLSAATLELMLREVRSVATADTRLALSVGTKPGSADHAARRRRFQAAVAQLGEPARNSITAETLEGVMTPTGWRAVELSDRSERAGFVLAAPV